MKGPRLLDRVRVERRADIVGGGSSETWDEAGESWKQNDDDYDPSDDPPGDGFGNRQREFVRIGPAQISAEIRELDGGETVLAGRLQGRGTCLVLVRVSPFTRTITSDDRLVVLGGPKGAPPRILDIRHAPRSQTRGGYLSLTCEDGVGT